VVWALIAWPISTLILAEEVGLEESSLLRLIFFLQLIVWLILLIVFSAPLSLDFCLLSSIPYSSFSDLHFSYHHSVISGFLTYFAFCLAFPVISLSKDVQ